ncbi:phosphatase PAP2 family protein [Lyngbya sp. CCY1209]|uniref:phosphatase PAP2 family protein n=1 Tax=Lyngbya sp. CCY1209 TaxID=2886103 RepID=UPI002D209A9C|nr:phosphatase PAP2 family protein [Lyngbya sp. CCY1209]MEB3887348.1 phosphatase PAP2 family protein [Lyngbya sp. CCY1209]
MLSLKLIGQKIVDLWHHLFGSEISSLLPAIALSGLTIAGFSLWGFVEITDEVLDQETEYIDRLILQAIRQIHTPFLDRLMVGITGLGDPLFLTAVGMSMVFILLFQGRKIGAIAIGVALGGVALLNHLLKSVFGRHRPELWERIVDVSFHSFPSGHAMISLVVYGIIAYWFAVHFRPWQWLIISAAIVLIVAIGFSRLYLGVHWPTDIVAGYAAGLVWLVACILGWEIARGYF